ncbi:MAG TPA: tRNA (guanosine(37)-N1)-methyltransferase TrmD [Dissulfurispiraceae bacterium]|nr:tRNA (guanosine(37)-N1)-methyltransferase TrmD [Dissulfurispiraceae bacterium]
MACGFDVITLFPEIIQTYLGESIMKRAVQSGLLDVAVHNLRHFTHDRHRTTDDSPYGGGAGMVMKVEPLYEAVNVLIGDGRPRRTILLTPQGKRYSQRDAERLAADERRLILVCGRYEGIDERARELLIDEELSIGDYILTGGELGALVIIDSVSRLVPGVLGDADSNKEESFTWGILDYPHYTRPPEFHGRSVPEVLLSGNHRDIAAWRRREALRRTKERRPELLERAVLSKEDMLFLQELCSERMKSSGEDTDEPDKVC